jgi:hypothetical protein
LNDVKSNNTIKDLRICYYTIICSTIAIAQMLNKPYIHYKDVKIMNTSAGGVLNCYNDMFIKILI